MRSRLSRQSGSWRRARRGAAARNRRPSRAAPPARPRRSRRPSRRSPPPAPKISRHDEAGAGDPTVNAKDDLATKNSRCSLVCAEARATDPIPPPARGRSTAFASSSEAKAVGWGSTCALRRESPRLVLRPAPDPHPTPPPQAGREPTELAARAEFNSPEPALDSPAIADYLLTIAPSYETSSHQTLRPLQGRPPRLHRPRARQDRDPRDRARLRHEERRPRAAQAHAARARR